MSIQDLIKFSELLTQLQKTERVIRVFGKDRWENDVEHSYMLAMLAWYFIEKEGLKLDKTKVIKYALAHDLVEAYAGDVYLYETDQKKKDEKHKKEKEAAERIALEFPAFSELHELVRGYEERKDEESKFVYALDKVQPVIQIYLDKGRTWNEKKVSLKMLVDAKKDKVALSPAVNAVFNELFEMLKGKDELFEFK